MAIGQGEFKMVPITKDKEGKIISGELAVRQRDKLTTHIFLAWDDYTWNEKTLSEEEKDIMSRLAKLGYIAEQVPCHKGEPDVWEWRGYSTGTPRSNTLSVQEAEAAGEPVCVEGGEIHVDSNRMNIGKSYKIHYLGKELFIQKLPTGELELFVEV